MTERLTKAPQCRGAEPPKVSQTDDGITTAKTLLILGIVFVCFAVLWPSMFYPMLMTSANNRMKPGAIDKTSGCCDVISETDIDTIKIMSELCGTIIEQRGTASPTPKEIVSQCRKAVIETCGIDISAALHGRLSVGHSMKQILEEVRSLNGSLCLKYHFGLSPWKLGVPHHGHVKIDPINSIRQERSSHMRAGMDHPAFRERGRAIPATGSAPKPKSPPTIIEGRPGPIPGMRPTMGGAGRVVPPPHTNHGFMGLLMPLYTVGFVVFFSYTVMKVMFKKKPSEESVGAPLYPPCDTNEQFQKEVFEANRLYFNRPNRDTSQIGDELIDQLSKELRELKEAKLLKELRETKQAMERIDKLMAQSPLVATHQDEIPNGSVSKEEQGSVTVMGMETTACSESGKKWSRPDSPVLPHPPPVVPKDPSPPPQQIFLEGALPAQSQILVADSATEAEKDEDDSPVVLSGKMTLSVISLDSDTNSSESKKDTPDNERRTSGSNTSDEFEKISATELEEVENRRQSTEADVLDEIKKELNVEDELMQTLVQKDAQVSLPVTDMIKEFLSKEEEALLEAICSQEDSEKDESTETNDFECEVKEAAEHLLDEIEAKIEEEVFGGVQEDEESSQEEELYDDDDDDEEEELDLRASAEQRFNGEENEITDEEVEDEDEEIEEIVEYVDNTDEEGEEIVEINGNAEN